MSRGAGQLLLTAFFTTSRWIRASPSGAPTAAFHFPTVLDSRSQFRLFRSTCPAIPPASPQFRRNTIRLPCQMQVVPELPAEVADDGVRVKPELFKCTRCNKVFREKQALDQHLGSVHRSGQILDLSNRQSRKNKKRAKPVWYCKLCDEEFQEADAHRVHLQEKHDLWECKICNDVAQSWGDARGHHKPAHNTFQCSVGNCRQSFKLWDQIYCHQVQRHDLWECEFCHELSKSEGEWRVHLATAHEIHDSTFGNRWACPRCGEKFGARKTLKQHAEEVHGAKECSLCNQEFDNQELLDQHQSEYHGAFPCDNCDKRFKSAKGLDHHIRVEHGKIRCETCGRRFKLQVSLDKHCASVGHPAKLS
jgi:uncharacterized C2H2 Zn-finger protein